MVRREAGAVGVVAEHRVHGGEASPSISKVLERAAIAGREEIAAGIRQAMANRGTPLGG